VDLNAMQGFFAISRRHFGRTFVRQRIMRNEILVCGEAAAARVADLLHVVGGGLIVREAHTKTELLNELAKGRQPICVVEHQVPMRNPTKRIAKVFAGLVGRAVPDAEDLVDVNHFLSQTAFSLGPDTTACDLLPELVAASPQTRFVITSHTRGAGLSEQQRALYKARKEVLKVMGFVNSLQNSQYLLKLFSRVYLGRTWKPKP
jgi:hypothetical protein